MDYRCADLPSLIAAANNVAAEAKSTFGHLSPSQLNWKPSAERWSVGQCFDHLLTTNEGYFPLIEDVLAGKQQTLWQSMPLLPGLAGKLLLKFVDPASARKIKAPKRFEPAQSDISASVINDFVAQQGRIAGKMQETGHLNLEKIVITSPAASAVTYSLMDAYRIIVSHEQRHFQQAKRVTEEAAFPG
jgi:hypothetical protein